MEWITTTTLQQSAAERARRSSEVTNRRDPTITKELRVLSYRSSEPLEFIASHHSIHVRVLLFILSLLTITWASRHEV
jgi:hypothetical protein